MNYPQPSLVGELMSQVALAENAFRSRWRLATLQRLDPELHQLLCEQIVLYDHALVTGTDDEAREQAGAMVRGWRAAAAAMESPLQPDDAYLTGRDPTTGLIVVIADCAGPRAQTALGHKVVSITPDEVAKIIAGLNLIAEAKSVFPDAEVITFAKTVSVEEEAACNEAARVAALHKARL